MGKSMLASLRLINYFEVLNLRDGLSAVTALRMLIPFLMIFGSDG